MKYLLISLLLFLSSCGGCKITYTVYIPSQNRFTEFKNKESAFLPYEFRAGDTVMYNGEKAIIIGH